MRTLPEHLKQAKDNEAFAEVLLQTGDANSITWAVTAFFYSVVHYGRAFVAHKATPTITTHGGFESFFKRSWSQPPDLFPLYRRLKDHSERARYECIAYTDAQVRDLRDNQMRPFRDAIKAALGVP
jgi:hypothetical protein